ncbi:MAG: CSLREA domain-containing protein, partial [Candidatus Promineifilaceae bacterium]
MKDYFGSTSRRYWMVALLALTLLFSVSLVSMALPLQEENTIQVNSFGDQKKSNDGVCTLREAIISANQNSVSGNRHGECNAGSAS